MKFCICCHVLVRLVVEKLTNVSYRQTLLFFRGKISFTIGENVFKHLKHFQLIWHCSYLRLFSIFIVEIHYYNYKFFLFRCLMTGSRQPEMYIDCSCSLLTIESNYFYIRNQYENVSSFSFFKYDVGRVLCTAVLICENRQFSVIRFQLNIHHNYLYIRGLKLYHLRVRPPLNSGREYYS